MSVLGTIGGFLGTTQPTQPGVGGISSSDALTYGQPVPGQPGVFVDPRTGQRFMWGSDGKPQVFQAQNLNQQTVTNLGNEGDQLATARALQAQQQQTLQAQHGLAASFNRTINDPGAPSVALSELGSGLSRINGTQLGNAAGASGDNALVARRTAAQNIAGAGVGLNAEQAQVRAGEVANAQTGLANVLNAQNNTLSSGINTATGAATSYAGQATQDQGTNAGLQEKEEENNAKQNSGLLSTIGGAFKSLAGSGAGS